MVLDRLDDLTLAQFDEVLGTTAPYLGPMAGVYSDWTPLADRGWLFGEDIDRDDPWQFKNFRVT